jgi:outer membrane protein
MFKISLFNYAVFGLFNICFSASAQTPTLTLQDCYVLALDRSATIAISLDLINQTEAQITQARAGYLPVLSLVGSTIQQAESTNSLTKNPTSQVTTSLNMSQNLFQGFRDINTVKQRLQLKEGYRWAKKQAQQQLYKDVAQAFFSVLIFQSDVALYNEQISSTHQRRNELNSAKKSGRARDSDLLIAESSIASLEAAKSRTIAQLITYQETFAFLTGLTQDVKLVNNIKLPSQLNAISNWLENSEDRPDVQRAQAQLGAAEKGVNVSQSGFYPSLGLNANYYFSRPSETFQGVDWDVGLVLSFPFFSGGLTTAQVNEAVVIRHTKELNLRLTQELASQAVRTIVGSVSSDLDQLQKLATAADLSRRSYNLVHRDNRLGVATNTDVLMALQTWQESKRNLERTRITATYDFVRLLVEASKVDLGDEVKRSWPVGVENE